MAITIVYRESDDSIHEEILALEDVRQIPVASFNKIHSLTASDEDLARIRNIFRATVYTDEVTIPMVIHKHEMTWYGDMAKTIVANL